MSVGRACGKVIVLGEHAVVYGEPAIASALSLGCEVEIAASASGPVLSLDAAVLPMDDACHLVCRAVREGLAAAGVDKAAVSVAMRFALPVGAGLGSSAALAVALTRAAYSHAGRSLDEATLVRVAHAIESVFHGNPSGLDAKIAMTGALSLYTRKDGLAPITPKHSVRLVIADTGVARSTQAQVSSVAQRKERLGEPIEACIRAIGEIARQGKDAFIAGDLRRLGELMDANQGLLSALSVSSPEIEALCGIARRAGAYGAKLTGAGGGGCIIALAPGREEEVAASLRPFSKKVIISTLGATP